MTRCDYAACDQPATSTAAGWNFCPHHLRAHHADQVEQRHGHLLRNAALPLAAARRNEIIRLNRQGLTDTAISQALGLDRSHVGNVRRSLGLPVNKVTARCGTRAGHQRHLTRGETPCAPCTDANRAYHAARYRARKQAA